MTRRGENGFILVVALWMIAALAALALAYSAYTRNTAPSASLPAERLRAEAALRAGVALCASRQLAFPKPARPDFGAFSTALGDIRLDVVYRSESARIDINSAPRDLIAALFVQLGAAKGDAALVADRLIAWRGRLSDDDRRSETAIYRKAGLAYGPLGAPFDNVLEISLLPGMSAPLAAKAVRFLTIFGAGKIDPLVADPVVLAALPGMTAAAAAAFQAARGGPRLDTQTLARLAGSAKDFVAADPNDYVRADIVAIVNARPIRAQVVVKIVDNADRGYDILYWRDDFDGAGASD